MSTDRISELRKQMAALEKEEAKLLKKSRASALKEIKALIQTNRFTASDLAPLFEAKRRGRKPGPKPGKKRGRKPKDPAAAAAPYTGKRRGRKPKVQVAAE